MGEAFGYHFNAVKRAKCGGYRRSNSLTFQLVRSHECLSLAMLISCYSMFWEFLYLHLYNVVLSVLASNAETKSSMYTCTCVEQSTNCYCFISVTYIKLKLNLADINCINCANVFVCVFATCNCVPSMLL